MGHQQQTEHLHRVLGGLVAGVDPARLRNDALRGAVEAAGGRQGLLVGLVDGVSAPLASVGTVPRVVLDVADLTKRLKDVAEDARTANRTRDEAIVDAARAGLTRREIAAAVGLSRSRVLATDSSWLGTRRCSPSGSTGR